MNSFHSLEQLSSVDEINNYPWPDYDEGYRYTEVTTQTKEFQRRGYAVCGEMYQTIFEIARLMRKMEAFLLDLIMNPELYFMNVKK